MLKIFTINCITFTKNKCHEEISSFDTKNKERFDHKKLRLTGYQYLSEEEQEEQEE